MLESNLPSFLRRRRDRPVIVVDVAVKVSQDQVWVDRADVGLDEIDQLVVDAKLSILEVPDSDSACSDELR